MLPKKKKKKKLCICILHVFVSILIMLRVSLLGWDDTLLKLWNLAEIPLTKALVQFQSNTCPHKPHTGPHNCGGKQFERWGCILGTFVPQPEHSTFQRSSQSLSNSSTALGSGRANDWHTDVEELAMISVAYLYYPSNKSNDSPKQSKERN